MAGNPFDGRYTLLCYYRRPEQDELPRANWARIELLIDEGRLSFTPPYVVLQPDDVRIDLGKIRLLASGVLCFDDVKICDGLERGFTSDFRIERGELRGLLHAGFAWKGGPIDVFIEPARRVASFLAADRRPVVTAFDCGDRVDLRRPGGISLSKLPSDERRKINRIALYEQKPSKSDQNKWQAAGSLLVTLPTMEARLSRCRVNGLGAASELDFVTRIRCLIETNPKAARVRVRARMGLLKPTLAEGFITTLSPSEVGFRTFVCFNELNLSSASQQEKAIAVALDTGFSVSYNSTKPWNCTLAKKLGLPSEGPATHSTIAFGFVTVAGAAPLRVVQFEATAKVFAGGSERLAGFPIQARHKSGQIRLTQRAAVGTDPEETRIAGRHHWIVTGRLNAEGIAGVWEAGVIAPVSSALHAVRDGEPVSTLPRFKTDPDADDGTALDGHWQVEYSLVGDLPADGQISEPQYVVITPGNGLPAANKIAIYPRRLSPAERIAALAEFMNIHTTSGQPLWARAVVVPPDNLSVNVERDVFGLDRSIEFGLFHVPSLADGSAYLPQTVRAKALEFTFPSPTAIGGLTETYPALKKSGLVSATFGPRPPGGSTRDLGMLIELSSDVSLAVLSVQPGGQDAAPFEKFAGIFQRSGSTAELEKYEAAFDPEAPIVLVLNRAEGITQEPGFELALRELILPRRDLRVDFTLRRFGNTGVAPDSLASRRAASYDLLIFDRTPLLLARVRLTGYEADLLAAETNEIATWSSATGGAWQMTAGSRGFTASLASASLGEAMEKRSGTPGIDGVTPIDYRIGPPTRLSLAPLTVQRLTEPPWNFRRLLYSLASLPRLVAAEFELLYGIMTRIERADLRLGEIEAQLGRVVGRQPEPDRMPWPATDKQSERYAEYRNLWKNCYRALRQRLAVLEPVSSSPGFDPTNSAFTDGISCELRREAHLRLPTDVDASLISADVPTNWRDPEGLAGGAAWALESITQLNGLWADPRSVSAEIRRLYFSSFGAWGSLKTSLNRGLTTLHCDVSMGRLNTVTVEQLGRITCGWHRAKHTVVYERSVLPSRQFYLEQDRFEGLPLLRKMEEYVEILTPEATFPPGAEPGFVQAMVFPKSMLRIKVDSRWGDDVIITEPGPLPGPPLNPRAIGYKIPLWRPDARPADVYPRPVVAFEFACAEDAEGTRANFSEPHQLFFVAITDHALSDPGNWGNAPEFWPAIPLVDYTGVRADSLKPPTAGYGDVTNDGVGSTQAPDVPVKPGLGAFTYHLEPAARAANVTAGRAEKAMGAVLRNVTLMRYPTTKDSGKAFPALTGFAAQLEDFLESLVNAFDESLGIFERGNRSLQGLRLTPVDGLLSGLQAGLTAMQVAYDKVRDALDLLGDDTQNLLQASKSTVDRELWQSVPDKPPQPGPCGQHMREVLDNLLRQALSILDFQQSTPALPWTAATRVLLGRRIRAVFTLAQTQLSAASATADQLARQAGDLENAFWKKLGDAADTAKQDNALLNCVELLRSRVAALAWNNANRAPEIATIIEYIEQLRSSPDTAAAAPTDNDIAPLPAERSIAGVLDALEHAAGECVQRWVGGRTNAVQIAVATARTVLENKARAVQWKLWAWREEQATQANFDLRKAEALALIGAVGAGGLGAAIEDYKQAACQALAGWQQDFVIVATEAEQELVALQSELLDLLPTATGWADFSQDFARRATDGLKRDHWEPIILAVLGQLSGEAVALALPVHGELADLHAALNAFFDPTEVNQLFADLPDLLGPNPLSVSVTAEHVRDEILAVRARWERQLRLYLARAKVSVDNFGAALPAGTLAELAKQAGLKLLRAFGDTPRVPQLDFHVPGLGEGRIPRIGYYLMGLAGGLPDLLPNVDLTPILARANPLPPNILPAFDLTVPTRQILDHLIPDELENFDISQIFKGLGGIPMAGLFDGFKLPRGLEDKVKITHGVDPETRRGWLQADVKVKFAETLNLFSRFGMSIRLLDATFEAHARIDAQPGQPPRQTMNGAITGDWEISAGGFRVATIVETKLEFDDSKRIRFHISPERVQLASVLAFLSDLLGSFGYCDSGFSIKLLPSGIQSILDLPLPNVQAGTFGIANLHLGFSFELAILDGFTLATRLFVGSRKKPFTLTIFILGGSGWVEFSVRYNATTHEIAADASIGIMASASLALSFGPLSGGIYAYFGITVEYTASNAAPGGLHIGIVIMFRGEVNLAGLVSVSLELGLDADYGEGQLTGHGYVSFEIKICWCFTLHFEAAVTYQFGKAGGERNRLFGQAEPPAGLVLPGFPHPPPTLQDHADRYVAMFEDE